MRFWVWQMLRLVVPVAETNKKAVGSNTRSSCLMSFRQWEFYTRILTSRYPSFEFEWTTVSMATWLHDCCYTSNCFKVICLALGFSWLNIIPDWYQSIVASSSGGTKQTSSHASVQVVILPPSHLKLELSSLPEIIHPRAQVRQHLIKSLYISFSNAES